MRFTVTLATLVLLSGMAAAAGQGDIIGAWDAFDDGCQSGYLEYRADGGFQQVYRRDRAVWINDQYLALEFACQRCPDGESAPPPKPRVLRPQVRRRRYRRRA